MGRVCEKSSFAVVKYGAWRSRMGCNISLIVNLRIAKKKSPFVICADPDLSKGHLVYYIVVLSFARCLYALLISKKR